MRHRGKYRYKATLTRAQDKNRREWAKLFVECNLLSSVSFDARIHRS